MQLRKFTIFTLLEFLLSFLIITLLHCIAKSIPFFKVTLYTVVFILLLRTEIMEVTMRHFSWELRKMIYFQKDTLFVRSTVQMRSRL